MKTLLLVGLATLCFAASEPVVSLASLKAVESSINDRMRSNINEPYDLLGPARGTYLEGYGAVFTVEMNLVLVSPFMNSPFKQTISDKEISDLHERKVKKVDGLKMTMRELMTSASKTLPGLPTQERIVMEAFLFNYRWENARGLPHRLRPCRGERGAHRRHAGRRGGHRRHFRDLPPGTCGPRHPRGHQARRDERQHLHHRRPAQSRPRFRHGSILTRYFGRRPFTACAREL